MAEENEAHNMTEEGTQEKSGACALKEDSQSDIDVCDFEKYKDAFNLLWPDADGTVHKDKLLSFFKNVLGSLYSEDMSNCLIDIMRPDEDGNITMDNFVHAFSLAYWTPESVAAMHNVLVTNPDIISKLADWRNVLKNLGLEMSDDEVSVIVQQAQKRATALLSAEMAKSSEYSEEDKEEVHRKSGAILESIHARLSSMDLEQISAVSSEFQLKKHDEDGDARNQPASEVSSEVDKMKPTETE